MQRYSAGLSHHFAVIWSNARPAFLCHSFFFPSLFLAEQFLFSPFILFWRLGFLLSWLVVLIFSSLPLRFLTAFSANVYSWLCIIAQWATSVFNFPFSCSFQRPALFNVHRWLQWSSFTISISSIWSDYDAILIPAQYQIVIIITLSSSHVCLHLSQM